MKVIKRNNDIVDFNDSKIFNAVKKAFTSTRGTTYYNLDEDCYDITKAILMEISDMDQDYYSVEEIQDTVENILMNLGYNDVAKNYIIYREQKREKRERKSKLYDLTQDKIQDIMNTVGIENDNANVDEASFSGKNNKVASHVLKEYALNNLMRPEIAQYHREGRLYTHDLDKYASGMHNCLIIDFEDLFREDGGGFKTRNADVRRPNDITTFFQLVAVAFQIQSQCQYGGVGSSRIDFEAAPFVAITFKKEYKRILMDRWDFTEEKANQFIEEYDIRMSNEKLKEIPFFEKAYDIAMRNTEKKCRQGAESLYHNLNTLESRAGSQVPFTSINFGLDTSLEGRMATRCLLQASIDGVGKYHTTSIFPISIFQIKKGINDKPGTPNYDLKRLALKSLSKRIYPNFVNCDAPGVDQSMGPANTMGCRTRLGKDRHGLPGYGGRGNITPVTINLVDIAIRNGICLGERDTADVDGFWNDLEFMLKEAETALLDRFEWIASKPAKSALFSYENDVMKSTLGRKLRPDEEVREVIKHGTLGVGFIGIAEAMVAMFGETHTHNNEIFDFAYKIVKRIYDFTKEASERNDLNFSCYATPAEGTCNTLADLLRKRYGIIKGVTDREYISNSFHIPVYDEISIYEKIKKEAVFSELCTGGYISYVELESTFLNNLDAVERIVDYAMDCGTYYLAINFPIDTCKDCGYSAEINTECCPVCGSDHIERLRRVTGYLTTDYRNFNKGKIAEVKDRVKHSKYTRY